MFAGPGVLHASRFPTLVAAQLSSPSGSQKLRLVDPLEVETKELRTIPNEITISLLLERRIVDRSSLGCVL